MTRFCRCALRPRRLVLLLLVPALNVLFRYVVTERMGTILLSVLVVHTSWHWMTERWGVLSQFPITWAAFSRAMFSGAMGWLILLMLLAGIVWVGFKVLQPTDPHVGEATAD